MITRRTFVAQTAGAAIASLGVGRLLGQAAGGPTAITVYKSASCGCCTKWVDHLRASGFAPAVHDEEDMDAIKDEMGVPKGVRSCHTALVDRYLVEGHVPAADLRRLLKERPAVAGLAVPGMPKSTPGMAMPGDTPEPYQVLAFARDGKTSLYARRTDPSGAMAEVVTYQERWRAAFERLNREWIETWFTLEDADRETFADPAGKIVAPGGQIFFVVDGDEVLGTCAVMPHSAEVHEIAKMAVAPEARGRGYGDLLMDACVAFSRAAGAREIVIVSNTRLQPAIRLYEKHGFVRVPFENDGRYVRADIKLVRKLPPET